jgi:protein phosphatase
MKHIIAAAVTKTGRRKNNQDNFMLSGVYAELAHDAFAHRAERDSDRPFFAAVCDGMGGESSGERASYIGCKTLSAACGVLTDDFSANKQIVTKAVLTANDRLCEVIRSGETGRMGSTVVAVLIQNDLLYYTNLGDSRLYFLRDGKLIRMTKDHTEGQMMVDAGVLTPEQLLTHPSRNKLNRHLGIMPEEMRLECPVYKDVALLPGDRLLIASDGVFGVLSEPEMTVILSGSAPAEEKAAQLVDLAYRNGSKDNMTAFVIEVEAARAADSAPRAETPFRDAAPAKRAEMPFRNTEPAARREAPSRPSAAKPQAKSDKRIMKAAVWIVIGFAVILLGLILLLVFTKCSSEPEPTPETEPPVTSVSPSASKPEPSTSSEPAASQPAWMPDPASPSAPASEKEPTATKTPTPEPKPAPESESSEMPSTSTPAPESSTEPSSESNPSALPPAPESSTEPSSETNPSALSPAPESSTEPSSETNPSALPSAPTDVPTEVSAPWAEGNWDWSLDNGILMISGEGNTKAFDRDNSPWYENRESIKQVVIEDGITGIGSCAFFGCSNLTGVTIPDSVTSIGEGAFLGCSSLIAVYFEGSEGQWKAVSIGEFNDELKNAKIFYKSN